MIFTIPDNFQNNILGGKIFQKFYTGESILIIVFFIHILKDRQVPHTMYHLNIEKCEYIYRDTSHLCDCFALPFFDVNMFLS